jgi:hypothetical protein
MLSCQQNNHPWRSAASTERNANGAREVFEMPEQPAHSKDRTPHHTPSAYEPDEADLTLDALTAPHLTGRQRLRRAALAAGVVLLALVVLLGSFPGTRSGAALLLFGPTPTSTHSILAGDDRYYIDTNVPDTLVTLDGKLVPQGSLGARRPLRLARGHHILRWQAGPFAPQSCVLTVPSSASDTCPRIATQAIAGGSSGFPFEHLLLLNEALHTLPHDRQQALLAELQRAAANFSATVQPGETYLAKTPGAVTGISLPLRATLNVQLKLATDQIGIALPMCSFTRASTAALPCVSLFSMAEECIGLCILPFSASSEDFLTLAPALLSWEYQTLAGQPVALDQPNGHGSAARALHPALFHIVWDGANARWHATLLSGPALGTPILVSGQQVADDLACTPAMGQYFESLPGLGWVSDVQGLFRSGPNPADGCLITAHGHDVRGNETTAQYLFRFGIYLAVDQGAQRAAPSLPVAGAAAHTIARTLEQYPGQIVNTLPLGVFG